MNSVNIEKYFGRASPYNPQATKKALIIGNNYEGTANQLQGCVNDSLNAIDELTTKWGYSINDIVYLNEHATLPTKENMLKAIADLITSAKAGDKLAIFVSSHGDTCPDFNGDETSGYDETLVPLDFRTAGEIVDDDLRAMVNKLPAGCRLTMIADSCHSGSVLDLPHIYRSGEENFLKTTLPPSKKFFGKGEPDTAADIFLIGTCKDAQTSADAYEDNMAQGAGSWALHKALKEAQYNISYDTLLRNMRKILREAGYPQIPELSTGRTITGREMFSF